MRMRVRVQVLLHRSQGVVITMIEVAQCSPRFDFPRARDGFLRFFERVQQHGDDVLCVLLQVNFRDKQHPLSSLCISPEVQKHRRE